ncbi:MAG: hypothetical protein ACI85K_000596 [Hyphomicrobiaceae bacterium]|jgi:hypothetical protein
MVRSKILCASLALCLSGMLAAQVVNGGGDEPTPQPTSTLLGRLKFGRIEIGVATEISNELKQRRTSARLHASKILRDHYLRHEKSFQKLSAKVMGNFEKLTKKAQRDLLGRKGRAEVAELRSESLAVSRRSSLTKQQIKDDVDPRVASLRALLMPSMSNVLAKDTKLDANLSELRAAHRSLRDWHVVYASIGAGLELHEDAAKHFTKYPPPQHPGSDQRIEQAISFAMFAGLAMSGTDRKALDANEAMRERTPHEEHLGTLRLNEIRYLLGLSLVVIDEKLSAAARDHSKDMHTLGFFSHTSPVAGKQRFSQRASNFGTSASAENIAAGMNTGHGAIRGWWYSPGHHRNMLGGHRRTGLGMHEVSWTQLFGG